MMAFNPRQARERARDMATRKARARLYQQRDAVERVAGRAAGQTGGHPARGIAQPDRCLDDGAGPGQPGSQPHGRPHRPARARWLGHAPAPTTNWRPARWAASICSSFYSRAGGRVTAADWQRALTPLFAQLVQGRRAIDAEQIYGQLAAGMAANDEPCSNGWPIAVDINHIITVQHGQEVERVRAATGQSHPPVAGPAQSLPALGCRPL